MWSAEVSHILTHGSAAFRGSCKIYDTDIGKVLVTKFEGVTVRDVVLEKYLTRTGRIFKNSTPNFEG